MAANQPSSPIEAAAESGLADASRRQFLGRAGLAGVAAAGLLAPFAAAQNQRDVDRVLDVARAALGESEKPAAGPRLDLYPGAVDANGTYVLPPLPYAYEALEPHIDAETMKLHHDKHHASYVKGLIAAEEGLAKARESGDFAQVKALSRNASFHGAGHFLHCIFWANMAAESGSPSADLAKALGDSFGTQEAFKNHFSAAAGDVEGNGWALLTYCIPAKKLVILQSENHNNLTQWANIPLLVLDVWEHAYYKKYSNMRADYVKAWWNVVNWQNIGERYDAVRSIFG